MSQPIRTNADGSFTIQESYSCPTALSQIYLVSSGGSVTPGAQDENNAAVLTAALGDCAEPGKVAPLNVGELTTVSFLSAVSPYAQSVDSIGAASSNAQGLRDAFSAAADVTKMLQDATAAPSLPQSQTDPIEKLSSLASIVSTCVGSAPGVVGNGTPCGLLFSYSRQAQSADTPHDTAEALLEIFRNPASNVAQIYSLLPEVPAFQPLLASAPVDWSIRFGPTPSQPIFSPAPGSYNGTQAITLTDNERGSRIYYSIDGTWQPYTGAIYLSFSSTIQAVAIANGVGLTSSGTYTITAQSLSLSALNSVMVGQTGQGSVSLSAPAPRKGITLTLSSSAPTVAGVTPSTVFISEGQKAATFTYKGMAGGGETTLSASAPGYTPSSTIVQVSPVAVALTPASVTLMPSQTQQFNASMTGSSNTAVTWSLSSAVGSISAAGLYTAPANVTSAQTVTVVATSVADPSKKASSIVSLVPPVVVGMTPASVTLMPSQTQQFRASVTGSSNAAVTWSLSSAVGSISAAGLYSAPANVTSAQTVTVVATSVADPSKKASSIVSLVPTPSLLMTLASSTVAVGGSASGTITLTAPSTAALTVQLSAQAAGSVSFTSSTVVVSPGQMSASFTLTGVAVGSVTVTAVTPGYTAGVSTVTVIPPAIPQSYFGMSVINFQNVAPTMSYGTARSWDAAPAIAWTDVNTAPGVYNFAGLDKFIQLNQARGADMIYTFGRTPQWASSNPTIQGTYGPGQCAPPSDLGVWDAYVTAIVTHAAGKIKYWELWNEPNSPAFYCGDMPTLVTMSAHAWKIIKAIDPTALVLSPPMTDSAGPSWQGYFLYLGGSKYVDVIAFHGYSSFQAEDINGIVAQYRIVMAAGGISNKPLWDTESSWAGNGNLGTPTVAQQTGYVAKSYLLHWSLGVNRHVWYAYDGGTTWGGLQTAAGTPSAATLSYIETQKWLTGASLSQACAQQASQVWACGLVRPGGYSAEVLWLSNSSLLTTVPAQYTEYRDLSGVVHPIINHQVTVGDQPILLETGPLP